MELWEKQSIFAQNIAKLLPYIESKGFHVTLGEAFRTREQAELYAKEGKGISDSLHCQRLAIDINLFSSDGKYLPDEEPYKDFGDYWKSLHTLNRWGGCFKRGDANHFEMQNI